MPTPIPVRRTSAAAVRRNRTPLERAAVRSARTRASRVREASHSTPAASDPRPTAVSTGAKSVIGPSASGALTSVRPKSSPNPVIATPTATARAASASVRQASSSASAVPTRNTTRAGTSRLRYEPTGSSTVSRSFQPTTRPAPSSPRPCTNDAASALRPGTASGTPATSSAAARSPTVAQPPARRKAGTNVTSAATAAPRADATTTSTRNAPER